MRIKLFSEGYVRYLTRQQDVRIYQLGSSTEKVLERLNIAQSTLNEESYSVRLSPPFKIDKELFYKPSRFEDKLFIRHLNRRMHQLYAIRHINRHTIARQIGVLLKSDTKLSIIRTDVQRFFRNVNFDKLIDKIRLDGRLTSLEIDSLYYISKYTQQYQKGGIPWGLSISSTLAEIYLLEFDSKIRCAQGTYYYRRFVDDIIIFTSTNLSTTKEHLENHLDNLQLKANPRKTFELIESEANLAKFSFLGYNFERSILPKHNEVPPSISIADSKLERLKNRIKITIAQYLIDRNYRNLRDRIKILTGNYTIEKSSHESPIKTGIYYNYTEINTVDQLEILDLFLHKSLISMRSHMTRKGIYHYKKGYKSLFRYSFVHGFSTRIIHRISPDKLEQLTKIWKR